MLKHLIIAAIAVFSLSAMAENPIIPKPQKVTEKKGTTTITEKNKILYSSSKLKQTAENLAVFIEKIHGLKLTVKKGSKAKSGDIILGIMKDPSITGDVHRVRVGKKITVAGANAKAVTYGCASVVLAMQDGKIERCDILDWPETDYRALMVDVARQWHPFENLKDIVDICHIFKINYLQFHFTDDQSFTIPIKAYPLLQGPDTRFYSLEQLNDLVSYAGQRNVIIIPEMDIPAHSKRMCITYPDFFGKSKKNGGAASVIDFGNQEVWKGVATIINELCDIFTNTPYIHLGGDEAELYPELSNNPISQATMAEYKISNVHQLFNLFFNKMNKVIQKRGKKLIIWEGFGPSQEEGIGVMDKSISVMMFDNFRSAKSYLAAGHDVFNASWFPLYILGGTTRPIWTVYDWDLYTFGNYSDPFPRRYTSIKQYKVNPTSKIPGAQMCSWEQPYQRELPSIKLYLPPMAERLWNRSAKPDYNNFSNRFVKANVMMETLFAKKIPTKINVTASKGVYKKGILLQWLPGQGYPQSYNILRNTSDAPASAKVIAKGYTKTKFLDKKVASGANYYYWIQAVNRHGLSELGKAGVGSTGDGAKSFLSYEGFDYPAGGSPQGKNGGKGWASSWEVNDASVGFTIKDDNLTYPGLKTSGKCVNMKPTGEKNPERGSFSRQLSYSPGEPGTTFWTTFLYRPIKVGNADFTFSVGKVGIKKRWGNGTFIGGGNYAPYQLKNDITYFFVIKYECLDGNDIIRMWLSPKAGPTPPSDKAPDLSLCVVHDNGIASSLSFAMQHHGMEADIDEFRVGSTWKDVCPQK